jgi:hypothetical protein
VLLTLQASQIPPVCFFEKNPKRTAPSPAVTVRMMTLEIPSRVHQTYTQISETMTYHLTFVDDINVDDPKSQLPTYPKSKTYTCT